MPPQAERLLPFYFHVVQFNNKLFQKKSMHQQGTEKQNSFHPPPSILQTIWKTVSSLSEEVLKYVFIYTNQK